MKDEDDAVVLKSVKQIFLLVYAPVLWVDCNFIN